MSAEQSSAPVPRPLRVPSIEALPPLAPRSPLAIFDEAITFLRIDPALLFGVVVVVMLPLRVIALGAPGSPLRDARPDQLLDIFVGNLSEPGAVVAAFITLILESLGLFTVAAIYAHITTRWYARTPITATGALLASVRRSPVLVVAWLIVHVAEALFALFVFGVGLLIAGPVLIVVAPVIGAERAGPFRSIRRSVALTSPKFVHVAIVYLATGVGALLMRIMLEFAPSLFGLELLGLPLWLVSGVADVVASIVQTAFVAAAATVLYLDLRVRREGIDLHLAMQRSFPQSEPTGSVHV